MANKAIKYRLYPAKEQAVLLAKTFGCCRYIYNKALEWRKAAYDADGTSLRYRDTAYALTAVKRSTPWLREVDSVALQQSLRHLDDAYQAFFAGKGDFPRFKSKRKVRASYTTMCQYPKNGRPTVRVEKQQIHLPVVGDVRTVIHRTAGAFWKLKSATVSMDSAGCFYCSVLYEYDAAIPDIRLNTDHALGLDYKSDGLYVDSEGHCADVPKRFREMQPRIAHEQKELSRKKGFRKGEAKSNNFKKQQLKVNKYYRKAANRRLDKLHKLSTEIANQYDVVCIEDLDMKAMSNKGFGNGKATMDNGWGIFVRLLEYKLEDRGKVLIRVDKWFPSSQLCQCGYKNPVTKDCRVRTIVCPVCGSTYDRDFNAAVNIKKEGLRILLSAA